MVQAVVQTTVTGLQGNPISATAPTTGQALAWSGSAWAPAGPFIPTTGGSVAGTLTATEFALPGGGNLQQGGGGGTNIQITSATVGISGGLGVSGAMTIGTTLGVTGGITSSANVTGSNVVATNSMWTISAAPNQGFFIGPVTSNNPGWYPLGNTTNDIIHRYNTSFYWQWNGSNGILNWVTQSGPTAQFFNGGNLTISGTLTQGSDETTKNNIVAYAPGVSIAAQLTPKTFIYNSDASNAQHLGFIAQDIQPLIPDAVSSSSYENASGATVTTLGLDVTAVVAVLANAVKQLISRVAALESHDNITPTAAQTA